MKLAKWQGLGNDYLIVEESPLPGPLTAAAIGLLCDRHLGVGSDGILLHAQPTGAVPGAVARMRVFNPDGGEPEMCGNGIRIFARYLANAGVVSEREFVVETLAGPIKPRLLDDGTVRVDMGRARFRSANIAPAVGGASGAACATSSAAVSAVGSATTSAAVSVVAGASTGTAPSAGVDVSAHADALADGDDVVDAVLQAGCWEYNFTFVDVGNPHCVIFVDDPAAFDVAGVGRLIERHRLFPNRTNVEFVRVEPDGSVRMRVWERGVGETQACGTGATAVGAACVRLGVAESPVKVRLLGGDLTIEVEGDEGGAGREGASGNGGLVGADPVDAATGAPGPGLRVFMTGPAEEVFTCTLSDDILNRLGWPAATGGRPAPITD